MYTQNGIWHDDWMSAMKRIKNIVTSNTQVKVFHLDNSFCVCQLISPLFFSAFIFFDIYCSFVACIVHTEIYYMLCRVQRRCRSLLHSLTLYAPVCDPSSKCVYAKENNTFFCVCHWIENFKVNSWQNATQYKYIIQFAGIRHKSLAATNAPEHWSATTMHSTQIIIIKQFRSKLQTMLKWVFIFNCFVCFPFYFLYFCVFVFVCINGLDANAKR